MILYVSIRSKLPASWMVRTAPSICCAAFNHNGTWECMLIKCHLPNMAIYHHIHISSYIYRIVYRIISYHIYISIILHLHMVHIPWVAKPQPPWRPGALRSTGALEGRPHLGCVGRCQWSGLRQARPPRAMGPFGHKEYGE